MRLVRLLGFSLVAGGGLFSCAPVSEADLARLDSTALSFNMRGAELGECGLSSQFERGRSASNQSAGGG